MAEHDPELCPRCGALFVCKVNNVLRCNCMLIEFTAPQLEYIRLCYDSCLCLDCLKILKETIPDDPLLESSEPQIPNGEPDQ